MDKLKDWGPDGKGAPSQANIDTHKRYALEYNTVMKPRFISKGKLPDQYIGNFLPHSPYFLNYSRFALISRGLAVSYTPPPPHTHTAQTPLASTILLEIHKMSQQWRDPCL